MESNGVNPSAASMTSLHLDGNRRREHPVSFPSLNNSHDAESSLPSASLPELGPLQHQRRGPGRPPTARRIWQQPTMKRRLVRLYLYTDESTLSTRQISHLISAVANLEEQTKSDNPDAPVPTGANIQSETRSTQYELQKLLLEGYRNLRPRNREEARQRVENFRRVRHGRVTKDKACRAAYDDKNLDCPTGSSESRCIHRIEASATPMNDGNGINATSFKQVLRNDETGSLELQLESNDDASETVQLSPHQQARLSWVRRKLSNISNYRPTSSICSEIRSLLSGFSSRISLSTYSLNVLENENTWPAVQDTSNLIHSEERKALITLCCQHRRECLHQLQNDGIDDQYLTMENGRDIWNQTPLHLAAKWAPNETALAILLNFFARFASQQFSSQQFVNVKNVEGETFMHILARRWCNLTLPPREDMASFCEHVHGQGYWFAVPNGNGHSFFECFLDELKLFPAFSAPAVQARSSLCSLAGLSISLFQEITADSLLNLDLTNYPLYRQDLWNLSGIYGCDVPLPDRRLEENHFHGALRSKYFDTEKFAHLIDRGSDLNKYNPEGKTCLMVLIEMFETYVDNNTPAALLEAFLSHGADLRLRDRDGDTALHYAVRGQLPSVAHRLISAGIDVHARNLHNVSATQLAVLHHAKASAKGQDTTGNRYARSQSILVRLFDSNARRDRKDRKDMLKLFERLNSSNEWRSTMNYPSSTVSNRLFTATDCAQSGGSKDLGSQQISPNKNELCRESSHPSSRWEYAFVLSN
ncbi:ankyrin [Xylariaceae sp. AK1471]|nr:ankyrin [Xylariaceae sp. AK1471]